ncbi:MAG TPA: hypothetical protein PKE31_18825 [Pseudomonadota bacterium]|nr:hypothetical protein [Pseudomonadota bacterium]
MLQMQSKFRFLCAGAAFVLVTAFSQAAFADATMEDEDTVTGDEFAPDWADPDWAAKLSQAQAESRIRGAGIGIYSSGGCSNRYKSNCTSLDQINDRTVNGIITLKGASGCGITITGGTETGHASGTYSHWNGYKVDISFSGCIDSYITRNFSYIGKRGDGAPMYKSAAGNIYAKESSHWDITYY